MLTAKGVVVCFMSLILYSSTDSSSSRPLMPPVLPSLTRWPPSARFSKSSVTYPGDAFFMESLFSLSYGFSLKMLSKSKFSPSVVPFLSIFFLGGDKPLVKSVVEFATLGARVNYLLIGFATLFWNALWSAGCGLWLTKVLALAVRTGDIS